jgi:hypothetical protein
VPYGIAAMEHACLACSIPVKILKSSVQQYWKQFRSPTNSTIHHRFLTDHTVSSLSSIIWSSSSSLPPILRSKIRHCSHNVQLPGFGNSARTPRRGYSGYLENQRWRGTQQCYHCETSRTPTQQPDSRGRPRRSSSNLKISTLQMLIPPIARRDHAGRNHEEPC